MKQAGYSSMRDELVQQEHERRSARSAGFGIWAAATALWLLIIAGLAAAADASPWPYVIAAGACVVAAVAVVWRRR